MSDNGNGPSEFLMAFRKKRDERTGLWFPCEAKELLQAYGEGERNFNQAYLGRANLEGANLGRANLEGANLEGANLGGTYLEGAYLGRANLEGANLEGANLGRANLEGANLGRANLGRANLGGANLGGTYLEGANLEGANLEGANLGGANLGRAYHVLRIGPIGSRRKSLIAQHIFPLTGDVREAWLKHAGKTAIQQYDAWLAAGQSTVIHAGCFYGSLSEFKARVEAMTDTTEAAQAEYRAAMPLLDHFASQHNPILEESEVQA